MNQLDMMQSTEVMAIQPPIIAAVKQITGLSAPGRKVLSVVSVSSCMPACRAPRMGSPMSARSASISLIVGFRLYLDVPSGKKVKPHERQPGSMECQSLNSREAHTASVLGNHIKRIKKCKAEMLLRVWNCICDQRIALVPMTHDT